MYTHSNQNEYNWILDDCIVRGLKKIGFTECEKVYSVDGRFIRGFKNSNNNYISLVSSDNAGNASRLYASIKVDNRIVPMVELCKLRKENRVRDIDAAKQVLNNLENICSSGKDELKAKLARINTVAFLQAIDTNVLSRESVRYFMQELNKVLKTFKLV